MNDYELPPLPHDLAWGTVPYSRVVEQMRDYARAVIAPYKAEVEQLKAVPMRYKRMEFNAQLQAEVEKAEAEVAKLRKLLAEARAIVERAATIKMNDGTYFDKDCACTLFLAALQAHLEKR